MDINQYDAANAALAALEAERLADEQEAAAMQQRLDDEQARYEADDGDDEPPYLSRGWIPSTPDDRHWE